MNTTENNINTPDWKIINTWKLEEYSTEEKSDLINNFSKSSEKIDNQKFVDRYKREQYISWLVNTDSFYDEWNTIFTNEYFNSKIIKIDWDNTIEVWEKYRDINKVWNYYVWINVKTGRDSMKIDWSETYTLLNKKWEKIQKLKWHPYFREDDNIITETYNDNWVDKNTIYNSEFSILIDGISKTEMYNYINTLNEDKNNAHKIERINHEEKLNNLAVNYAFKFKWDNIFIDEIKNKDWSIIFSSEWGKYKINKPFDLTTETINHNRKKEDINNWLFLISGESKTWEISDIFINEKDDVRLDFNDYVWYTFLKWNVVKHFINSNDSELYNAKTWEKLWKSTRELDNEHNFKFITLDDWKYNLVENKTWNLKQQEFDKYIKQYDEWDKKIVIVENNWEIQTIEIQK